MCDACFTYSIRLPLSQRKRATRPEPSVTISGVQTTHYAPGESPAIYSVKEAIPSASTPSANYPPTEAPADPIVGQGTPTTPEPRPALAEAYKMAQDGIYYSYFKMNRSTFIFSRR